MKRLVRALLIIYKKTLSPIIGRECKYTPTCSVYMLNAVEEYGFLKGVAMGIYRVLRCNPFSKGGFDPVKINMRGKAKYLL